MTKNWVTELEQRRAQKGVVPQERQAASNPELFRRLVRSVSEYAIFMLDPYGHILSWNPGAERIKQYREEDVIGRNFRMLYTPDDQQAGRPEKNLDDALRYGHTEDIGWRMKKDGSWFWADAVITAVLDDDGKVFGFAKIIRDLTVMNTAATHARALEVSQAADLLKNQFLALISHELRTPLTTIRGYADLVEDGSAGPTTQTQNAFMGNILEATASLTKLVDDLIDMTSFQSKAVELDCSPMSFSEVVQGVVLAVQVRAQGRHLWLANHVSPDLPPIVADAHRVSQILINILENAIKFTPDGGRIDIQATMDDKELRCEVTDTGSGITPAAMEGLFQKFNQGDMSATRTAGGLGIGLHISKTLVEAHGGRIGALSAPKGQGSTFWFTLPRG